MRFSKNVMICMFLAFVFAGCATLDAGRGKPVNLVAPIDNKMGMIIGRIDDAGSKNKVTYITIWELKAKFRRGNKGLPVRMFPDGTFVAVNIKPGKYFISMITSGKRVAGILGGQPYKPFEVKPGKAAYWGTYKAVFKNGSQFLNIPARVKLTKSGKKERRKAFKTVLKSAKGTRWERVLKRSM